MNLPTLYKQSKTATLQFLISYIDDTFTVQWGQVDGKQQTKTTQCFTTNLGKSNQRNPIQQAEFEAKALYQNKIDHGYSTTGTSSVQLPMKVSVWTRDKLPPKASFPLYSSIKLNGVNATYKLENGELNLYSRGGKLYPPIPHLEQDIRAILPILDTNELNGELYIHNTHLQTITSYVKKSRPESANLEFHIFDLPSKPDDFTARNAMMKTCSKAINSTHVHFVNSRLCYNHEDIEDAYEDAVLENYEGTVIKQPSMLYIHNTRSTQAWKYKKTLDGEFKILSYTLDKNSQPVFTLQNDLTSATFKCKPKGTAQERAQIVTDFDTLYLNQFYKIEYESRSIANIPTKPIGICLRHCTPQGEPLE